METAGDDDRKSLKEISYGISLPSLLFPPFSPQRFLTFLALQRRVIQLSRSLQLQLGM